MADRWFYWQKAFDGKWNPVFSVRPPGKKPEGSTRAVAGLRKLGTRQAACTLKECAERYPVPQDDK